MVTWKKTAFINPITPFKNWFRHMKQNISISNCFIFCAHKIVEHNPAEKHMVYGRPFEGTAIPAKLAEKACPVT